MPRATRGIKRPVKTLAENEPEMLAEFLMNRLVLRTGIK